MNCKLKEYLFPKVNPNKHDTLQKLVDLINYDLCVFKTFINQ